MEEASWFLQGQDDGEVGEGTDDELLNAQEVKLMYLHPQVKGITSAFSWPLKRDVMELHLES